VVFVRPSSNTLLEPRGLQLLRVLTDRPERHTWNSDLGRANLLDDGVADALVSVGASGAHTSVPLKPRTARETLADPPFVLVSSPRATVVTIVIANSVTDALSAVVHRSAVLRVGLLPLTEILCAVEGDTLRVQGEQCPVLLRVDCKMGGGERCLIESGAHAAILRAISRPCASAAFASDATACTSPTR
jgi:hypothetical protein